MAAKRRKAGRSQSARLSSKRVFCSISRGRGVEIAFGIVPSKLKPKCRSKVPDYRFGAQAKNRERPVSYREFVSEI